MYLCSLCARKCLPDIVAPPTSPSALELYDRALEEYKIGMATGQEARLLRASCQALATEPSIDAILTALTTAYHVIAAEREGLFLILQYDGLQMLACFDHLRDDENWYKISHWVGRLVSIPWVSLRDPAFHRATLCYFGNMGTVFSDPATAKRFAFHNPYSVYLGKSGVGAYWLH